MMKKILFTIFILCAFSCSKREIGMHFPNTSAREFQDVLVKAKPEFRQGWDDGCSVGAASGANKFYKTFYDSAAVDGYKMANSAEYKIAWNNAFWYCYRYTYVKQKSAVWNSIFSGYR